MVFLEQPRALVSIYRAACFIVYSVEAAASCFYRTHWCPFYSLAIYRTASSTSLFHQFNEIEAFILLPSCYGEAIIIRYHTSEVLDFFILTLCALCTLYVLQLCRSHFPRRD